MSTEVLEAKLHNIKNYTLQWGQTAGEFLSIEPLMRYLVEIHPPLKKKVDELIAKAKTNRYTDYWNCYPHFLVNAIIDIFKQEITPEEIDLLLKFSGYRGKFNHGNFIELMELMGIEPSSRRIIAFSKREKLKPGEIYESIWSMKNNGAFDKLRQYSSDVNETLTKIFQTLSRKNQ